MLQGGTHRETGDSKQETEKAEEIRLPRNPALY